MSRTGTSRSGARGGTVARRRAPLLAALLIGALVAAAWFAGVFDDDPAQVSANSPNVVFVMVDDAVMDDMVAMPFTREKYARRGVTFENSFASFPLCCPSRVTFLTGQYAHNHGILSNKAKEGGGYENYDDDDSLPVTLREAGYRTGFVGKYLNGYKVDEIPQGWSTWVGKKGPMYDYELNVNGEIVEYGSDPEDYEADVLTDMAGRFLEESAKDRAPFFLFLSYQAPHGEKGGGKRKLNPRPAPRHRDAFANERFDPPPSFDEADVSDKPSFVRETNRIDAEQARNLALRQRARRASLRAVDDGMREVFDRLRELGVEDDTYVFFASDNGYMLGEHRQTKKTMLYEESLRVPLLGLGPGMPEGKRVRELVTNVDWAPTVYDITGVKPGRKQDGRSLVPIAQRPDRRVERDVLIQNQRAQGVRSEGWVYIEHDREEGKEFELYDLRADPFQMRNLVDTESGAPVSSAPRVARVLEELKERLEELRGCAGEECG